MNMDVRPRTMMNELNTTVTTATGENAWRKVVRAHLRVLAWGYDFLFALFVVSWVIWGELVLNRLFGVGSGAWADCKMCAEEALYQFELKRGLAAWQAHFLSCLPELFEYVLLWILAALLVRWMRRVVRTTPGEWTFSVRRNPCPAPVGGWRRHLGRSLAGIAAFAALVILWTILDMWLLDPV